MGKNVFLTGISRLGARVLGTWSMLIWHITTKDPYTALDVRLFEKAIALDPRYRQAWEELGDCFSFGWGTPVDKARAYEAYCHGAALGSARCCKHAADIIYRDEHGDRERMYRFYRKAAEQGYNPALADLGLCYELGDGVPQNAHYAVRCYEEADRLGVILGTAFLGDCYYHGNGVSQDRQRACALWKKAARKGDGTALCRLGIEYRSGDVLEQDLPKAVRLFRKAVKKNSGTAMYLLGLCFLNGKGVQEDRDRGLELIRQAAEVGNIPACSYLGICEEDEAFLEKAVRGGDPDAMCWRGNTLRWEEKFLEASEFYEKSWEQGYESAGYALAEMYLCHDLEPMDVEKVKAIGEALEKSEDPEYVRKAWAILSDVCLRYTRDFERGVSYSRLMAEQGEAVAYYNLAMAYRHGLGVEADEAEAERFLKLALDLGYEPEEG